MRKIIPWWVSLAAFVQTLIVGTIASWFAGKYFPNWILEYQLAFVVFAMIIAGIILTIIVKIIWHNCGDDCRGRYDIEKIRSQYRKRK